MYCFKRACVASGVSVSVINNVWPLSAGVCTSTQHLFMLGKHLQNRLSQLPSLPAAPVGPVSFSGSSKPPSLFLAVSEDPPYR